MSNSRQNASREVSKRWLQAVIFDCIAVALLCSGWVPGCLGSKNDNTKKTIIGSTSTTGTVDRVSIGEDFLAKAGHSEGCGFTLDRGQERMREWENSRNKWIRHGVRRSEIKGKERANRQSVLHSRMKKVLICTAAKSRNVTDVDEGRESRYCSSVEGDLIINKGELQ